MKIIRTDNEFMVYNDSLKVYNQLPADIYTVEFSKFKGFYLESFDGMKVNEKIYGVHPEKVEKVLKSFSIFERSLGVILSGNKGIGKSLFGKLLAQKALVQQMPVIIINKWIPGIASFIDSITQEVMVFFDEFDKTFSNINVGEGNAEPQTELLGLFDGVSNGKKLYVITCNDLSRLNEYLVNRPGRFHYHYRFEYPTPDEIKEYLEDKLNKEYYPEINNVIDFSRKVDLNYDCLRAIAFEINTGLTFKEAIKDLNILNYNSYMSRFNVTAYFSNGTKATCNNVSLNFFDTDKEEMSGYWFTIIGKKKNYVNSVYIEFAPNEIEFNELTFTYSLKGEKVKNVDFDEDDFDNNDEDREFLKTLKENSIIKIDFKKQFKSNSLAYNV